MHGLQKILLFHILTCLGRNVLGSEIIHGDKAPEGSMLYMASVQNSNYSHACGGFLVSQDFVLTAAHCFNSLPTNVVIGTHDLGNVQSGQRIQIAKRCRHELYKRVATGNDLMLLKLSTKAQLNAGVEIIQLPQHDMKFNEQTCQVAGWGAVHTAGKAVSELMTVNVSVMSQDQCQKAWQPWIRLPDKIICAGGSGTYKGFCQGDSGGPLVCNGIAVGVVSFNRQAICKYPDLPNIYVDISKYLPWIRERIGKQDC